MKDSPKSGKSRQSAPLVFPKAMKAQPNWMVRAPGNKDPISALSKKPDAHVPNKADEGPGAWRYHWKQQCVAVSYADATAVLAADQAKGPKRRFEGLNYVLHPRGDYSEKARIISLDFDNAFDEEGNLWPEIEAQLAAWEGYVFVEYSRSKRGIHVFILTICQPFTNINQAKVNEHCAVDILCSSQVACTGIPFGPPSELEALPFSAIQSLPYFTYTKREDDSTDIDFQTEFWDKAREELSGDEDEKLIAEMKEWPPCVSGEESEQALIDVARSLARRGITGWRAVDLLKHVPSYGKDGGDYPWEDKELIHKVEDVFKRALHDQIFDKGLAPEFDDDIDDDSAIETAKGDDAKKDDWFRVLTLDEIEAEHPRDDLSVILDLLQARSVANIIASSKLGKSYFIAQLIISFVAGLEWLGFKFGDAPRRVLVVDNELKPRQIWRRLKIVAEALGVDFAVVKKGIKVVSLRGQHRKLSEIAGQLKRIPSGTYGLIILDSNYRALDGNESDPEAVGKFYDLLIKIASRANAAVIGIHHTSKGNQSEKEKTDVGSGSGVIARAVDAHIILRKHEEAGCVVMEFELRDFKCPEPIVLRREFPLWVVAPNADPTKLASGRSKARPTLLHVRELMKHPEFATLTRKDLEDQLMINSGCVKRAAADLIRELIEDGTLIKINGKNNTYSVTLAPEEEEDDE